MNATQERDNAERLVHEIDELNEIESSLDSKEARHRLQAVRGRLLGWAPSVRLSVATDLLELSLPTVRAWIERGLLEEVADSWPRRVTLRGILDVRPVLRELRSLGRVGPARSRRRRGSKTAPCRHSELKRSLDAAPRRNPRWRAFAQAGG